MSELDNPIWGALTGPQRHLGTSTELAARFDPAISPFGAMADAPTDAHWADLAAIAGPGGQLALVVPEGTDPAPGAGWSVPWQAAGVQMVGDRIVPLSTDPPAAPVADTPVPLGVDDVGDMLVLAEVARPGPFLARTVEFGGYVGIRREGRLVAMAGERMRPPGYAEISAVATDPDHRRQGLAQLLARVVASAIDRRGETPFLHAAATNTNAIRLYESMGFVTRRRVTFLLLRAPGIGDGSD
jgi:ribosomal protein S18 acetylase RimI-like enzyme